MVKCSKVKNGMLIPIQEFPEGLIFSLFDPQQLIISSSRATALRNCFANFVHICSKFLILPWDNFRYHSRGRPSKVNRNTQNLWACVKPCILVISLKRLIYTKYLRSENRKSSGITILMISSERGDALSNIILHLGAIRHLWSSSITWTNRHTSPSSSMAWSGFCTITWSHSRTTAFRCYLNISSQTSTPPSGFNWPWFALSWPSTLTL